MWKLEDNLRYYFSGATGLVLGNSIQLGEADWPGCQGSFPSTENTAAAAALGFFHADSGV